MARTTVTHFTDDLDGSTDNVETVKFGLFGTSYEIDLSDENQDKLESALEPFVKAARKASTTSTSGRRAASKRSSDGPDLKAVRAWAEENDIAIAPRGRIANDVMEKYQAANS